MPIPGNPLAYTLVYVLEGEGGPVLIDAGWQAEESWTALTGGLRAFGFDVAEVRGVVVTHFHPDHAGLAGRVREASGAWIAMHHADADLLRRFRAVLATGSEEDRRRDRLLLAGADESELGLPQLRPHPAAEPDRELSDGELVDLPGRKLRVVWTPGHSPGHICLHLEDGDRMFTGDHVLPVITPHIGLYPYDLPDVDPLGDFLTSLERMAEHEVAEALPAHQYRFTGLARRTREIRDHHEDRLSEILGLLSETPATLWEVTAGMRWRAPWEDMPVQARQMAAGEAAAHLRALEQRGRARRHGTTRPLRFVRG